MKAMKRIIGIRAVLAVAALIVAVGCANVYIETSLPEGGTVSKAAPGDVIHDIRSTSLWDGTRTVYTLTSVGPGGVVIESAEYVKVASFNTKLATGPWRLKQGLTKRYAVTPGSGRFMVKGQEFIIVSVAEGLLTYKKTPPPAKKKKAPASGEAGESKAAPTATDGFLVEVPVE